MLTENVKNWLFQNTFAYHNKQRVLQDVQDFILKFQSFPKTDYYYSSNQRLLLLTLTGTVKNLNYQIWMPLEYPLVCPILITTPNLPEFRMVWNRDYTLVKMFMDLIEFLARPVVPSRPNRITGALNARLEYTGLNNGMTSDNRVNYNVDGGIPSRNGINSSAPPLKPNPPPPQVDANVRQRADILSKIQPKLDSLTNLVSTCTKLNSTLTTNNTKLMNTRNELQSLKIVLERNNGILEKRIGELKMDVYQIQSRPDFHPDHNIIPNSTLYQQYFLNLLRLVDEVVDVLVLNDLLKVETKRFYNGNEGEVSKYLKAVRGQSRALFMKKVLIQKIKSVLES